MKSKVPAHTESFYHSRYFPLKITNKLLVFALIWFLLFASLAALLQQVKATETWTSITLPYTVTTSGNYRIIQDYSSSGNALTINSSNVVVDGQNHWLNTTGTTIIVTTTSSNILLQNIKQSSGVIGLQAYSNNLTIMNSLLSHNSMCGLWVENITGFNFISCEISDNFRTYNAWDCVGSYVSNCRNFNIIDSYLIRNSVNLGVFGSRDFTIQNSNLNSNGKGLTFGDCHNATVEECEINDNWIGFSVSSSSNLTVRNSDFYRNNDGGILSEDSSDYTFQYCIISDNGDTTYPAFRVIEDSNFTIKDSYFNSNRGYAFYSDGSNDFTVKGCTLFNNGNASYAVNSNNFTFKKSNFQNNIDFALYAEYCVNFTLQDVVMSGGSITRGGVWSENNTKVTIRDCDINDFGMGLSWSSGVGIFAYQTKDFTLQGTDLSGNDLSNVYTAEVENFLVQNCTINNAGMVGLWVINSRNITVKVCTLSENKMWGLAADNSLDLTINHNVFKNNGLTAGNDSGALSIENFNCSATNNSFINNSNALTWSQEDSQDKTTSTFANNIFTNNRYTFFFDYRLANNFGYQKVLFYNNLVNDSAYINPLSLDLDHSGPYLPFNSLVLNLNSTQQSGPRVYSNGPLIGGNFWALPNGKGYSQTAIDANHDGFIDAPFDFFGNAVVGKIYDYLPYSSNFSRTLIFTAGTAQSLYVGQASSIITVQCLRISGDTSAITISLTSNSTTAKFSDASGHGVNQLTIPGSSDKGNFTYIDTTAGSPTITVSGQEAISTTTQFTILAIAAKQSPDPTPTPQPTTNMTPTPLPSSTPSQTPNLTPIALPTPTPSTNLSPTPTLTPTPTARTTPSPTPSLSPSPTATLSASPSQILTPSNTQPNPIPTEWYAITVIACLIAITIALITIREKRKNSKQPTKNCYPFFSS